MNVKLLHYLSLFSMDKFGSYKKFAFYYTHQVELKGFRCAHLIFNTLFFDF